MVKNFYSIMLSLSGICQSIALVNQLSEKGYCDNKSCEICIDSILTLYPTTVLSVYGNQEKNLKLGIKTLMSLLNINTIFQYKNSIKIIRYILNIIHLEKKLKYDIQCNNILFKKLSGVIEDNLNKIFTYDVLSDRLAEIYIDTISKLGSRIQIFGSPKILRNISVQNKIRCLLLSGIRSAVLWKQMGGNCSQFIFKRNYIFNHANIVLNKFL